MLRESVVVFLCSTAFLARCALSLCALLSVLSVVAPAMGSESIESRIRQRIAAEPSNASNWRLLGKIYHQQANLPAAEHALRKAILLDSLSPANHFDLGRVLVDAGRPQEAVFHLKRTVELAPDCDYAADASALLQQLREDPIYATLISFEGSWLDTPRADDHELPDLDSSAPATRLDLSLEAGLMFNSNVELAPISRQLSTSDLSSFQTYLVPEAQYLLIDEANWQLGALLDTYFNLNEDHLDEFNLQHYEPGFYFDRAILWHKTELATRVGYNYSYDLFGGRKFGDRHLLTTSLVAYHQRPMKSIVYWAIGYTEFSNDGTVPATDSADGMTNTIGFSRSWQIKRPRITELELGADVQLADLDGSDMAYRGVFIYSEAKLPFVLESVLAPLAGWGYRSYPDFTGAPTRDENLISAAISLEKELGEHRLVTAFFSYDRFDTPNPDFRADRYTTGVFATFRR